VGRLQRLAGVTPARLALVVLIAVAEELLWRGLLFDALRQRGVRPLVAVSLSALVYAGSQLGPRSPWLCVAGLGFGVLWGVLRLRAGMWAAVVAHLVWSLAILGALPLG
jgi:membrane protease YdiL (CAAX protease family)